MYQIDAHTLINRLHNGEILNLLDVRQEIEYHTYNIGGYNVPLSKLNKNPGQINYNKTDEIIVVCKVGLRSKTAQSILINNGYQNVKNLKGGLIALQKLQR
ncbi:rhodanese-like domain-containing protein [Mucilaginibacter sp.]|uniref:rhodanese-like domain-containing protein n=1 Tax=Mucilaginibacter sp. TaxID=1882438 RepID=UPI002610A30B|nr:rhodanese-like domain-containing protein [Mucilaginibacter sp.]MDB4924255.1 rhodanese [Mucilaginibacter sp.]